MNIDNLEVIEVSIDKDTFFEGEPFNSDGEYIIIKDGDKEMSIGFDIDVDFDIETSTGDYITPSFDDVENVEISFTINDFDVDEEDVKLTPELEARLIEVLARFVADEN